MSISRTCIAKEVTYKSYVLNVMEEKPKKKERNPEVAERRKAYIKEWVKNNPDKVKAKQKRFQERNKERLKAKRREKLYSLSDTEYTAMRESQNNSCAICGTPPPPVNYRTHLDVDHCHTTGVVRGLLCNNCNRGLGHFKDNPELLIKAAQYLKRSIDEE